MSTWRTRVAAAVGRHIARVTVVADLDAVFSDDALRGSLEAHGQQVLSYADPIEFRRHWQSLRCAWSDGATTEVVIAVSGDEAAAHALPFDVVRTARMVSLRAASLFPGLSPSDMALLPVSAFDTLDELRTRGALIAEQRAALRHAEQLSAALDDLTSRLPYEDSPHAAWTTFAGRWGSMNASRHASEGVVWHRARIDALRARVDLAFATWLGRHYGALASLPAEPPVMLHHVPRAMERWRARSGGRVALLVLDGMAFDQWVTLSQCAALRPDAVTGVFAWVPTTTAVSRQALFAGEIPARIADRLRNTSGEGALWEEFWARRAPGTRAAYQRGLRGDGSFDELQALIDDGADALGLVVDLVDRVLHGSELGMEGVHQQLRLWIRGGWLRGLLERLRAAGYTVFLTADHGNIEAVGRGPLRDGGWAEVRGERARIYDDAGLRDAAAGTELVRWPGAGLPPDLHVALAPERTAFVERGHRVVVHGGACLEEVIVPLVRFDP